MTDLTEQWKKGKLPSGWFWVECCRDKEIYAYTSEYLNHMYRPKNSDKIIEQVPSYDEWIEKTKSLKVLAEAYCKEIGLRYGTFIMRIKRGWSIRQALGK